MSEAPEVRTAHRVREDGGPTGRDVEALVLAGEVDAAVAAFRQCWPRVADSDDAAEEVAACLRALVRLGNTDRALDALLPRVDRVGTVGSVTDRMWLAATAAWVLRHARRLGMSPERVGHRDAAAAEAELSALADRLASDADAVSGGTRAADALAAAHDDGSVPPDPVLPPTRMPAPPPGSGSRLRPPAHADEVVEIAERARRWRRDLDPALERLLRGWLETREAALPLLSAPEHWSAAALLDRSSVHLLRDAVRERIRLDEAVAEAERADDAEGAAHARCDLAVLDVREAVAAFGADAPETGRSRERTLAAVDALDAAGWAESAAASRRWYALTVRPADAVDLLVRAGRAYGELHQPYRHALCLLDAATPAFATDPAAGHRLLDEGEHLADGHPVLMSQAFDLRARVARASGDLAAADALYARAAAVRGVPDGTRMAVLFAWCDLVVDRAAWAELEPRAADALALAVRLRDPVALAVAQRHLGLSWLEQGRPVEAAELLAAALPVVAREVPALVGPTAWALGNAALALGAWDRAREAFDTAAEAFEAAGRAEEAAHARYRAGTAAWDGEDLVGAAHDLDAAVTLARHSGTLPVLLEALRSRAAVRAASGDVDGGLAALDTVLAEVQALAAVLPPERHGEEPFDPEVLEPDVLREGAHVLADVGRTDEALERLARAEALVGGDFELVLRAETGVVLAEADRLEQAEPVLRRALLDLGAAGLADEQVQVAGALARALDRAGRVPDAEAVWAQYGAED
ncbi:hypothetical protein [Phycicoccus avicenniae]|uniref:hypothetical protein n=1 Tax=Phycicoccus avicenniae TaxID=2828860 RepID=UPI003D2C399F